MKKTTVHISEPPTNLLESEENSMTWSGQIAYIYTQQRNGGNFPATADGHDVTKMAEC